MTLEEYMTVSGQRILDLARRSGYTPAAISMVISGQRKPSWRFMSAMRAATDGRVEPNDFFPPHAPPAGGPKARSEAP